MRIYPLFIPHAGCPHRCLFCDQHRTSGGRRAPTPAEVGAALEAMLPARGDGEVAFYGGSFTLLPPPVRRAYLSAAAPYLAAGRVGGIRVSTRPDAVDAEIARGLHGAGVTTVELGCQSFDAGVLAASERRHGVEAAEDAVACLRRRGIGIGLQLMPGLPGGDGEEALRSLERAIALAPDFLRIYPTVVLRGSRLEALYRQGRYRPLELEATIALGARMLWRCRQAGIPVIRFGLQAEPGFDSGEAWVAGPYHPALGQLVRSRLWRRGLTRSLGREGAGTIRVHPADLADAVGHGGGNRRFLEQHFGSCRLLADRDVPREHLAHGGRMLSLQSIASFAESPSS